ncbi:MAG: lipopolysaccharide heptosyltransferase II [Blastocatellia bacterium]|nr:lipopolysaccharide heptosyltransferase II [Blastocatellia bacterium]
MYNFEYWLEHAIEKSLRIYNALLLRKPGRAPEPSRVKKILICAYHGIGNFILYTPTIDAIRRYFPEAEIDLQVGNKTGCEDVLADSGHFRKVFDVSNKAGWRIWIEHILHIRHSRYNLIINEFHSNSYFLAMLVSFSGATYRVGHVKSPGWPDRYGFIYNVAVKMEESEHEVDRYFALARALNIPDHFLKRRPFIHINTADEAFADQFLKTNKIPSNKLLIGIQMGTSVNMRWKQWSPERYQHLVKEILTRYEDSYLLMLGSPNELDMIEQSLKQIGQEGSARIAISAGSTTIKEVAALIKRCNLVICNDSGLMHVSVAVDTPVVAIYGPTDYRRTAPIGNIHTIVRKNLSCSPCFRLEGDAQVQKCTHHDCLNKLEVNEVIEAVERKISELVASQ